MADALTRVRSLQGEAQAAFRRAQDAGDQAAMRQLEEIFEQLLKAEDKLLLNNLAVSAAAVADLAERLRQATREIEASVGGFLSGSFAAAAVELEDISGAMHDGIRHESAHEPPVATPPASTAAPSPGASGAPPTAATGALELPPRTPEEYARSFAAMAIRPDWIDDVDGVVDSFFSPDKNRRYRSVERATGVPWWVIAILHSLEASQNFGKHLHNGDPLSAPTVREPNNRPANWHPGITWEESAADAITNGAHRLHRESDWSVGNVLAVFERFNGLGYRNRDVMSPYVWSGSAYYEKGKFVADGVFDSSAVSAQVGAAVLLRRIQERGEVSISATRNTVTLRPPAILGSREQAEVSVSAFPHAAAELDFPLNANAVIKAGASGMIAKRVQEWCCLHGRSTGIDSDYGDATAHAVTLFQRDNALPVTGEVDRDTWLLLTAPMRRALAAVVPGNSLNVTYLKVAAQHVRQHPSEVGGNNCGPWVRLYMAGRDGKPQLWCAGFVCTLMAQVARDMGIGMPFARQVGVDALVADAKRDGRFLPESALSEPRLRSSKVPAGSLFVVRASATDWTHVGIVAQVEKEMFSTIEGNTNGQNNDGANAGNSSRRFADKDFLMLA